MPVDLKPWKDGFQPNEGKIVNKKAVQISLPGKDRVSIKKKVKGENWVVKNAN